MKQKKTKARKKMEGSWTKERGGGTIVVWIKRRGDRVLRKFRTTRTDESLIEWQKGSRGSWPLTFHCDFAGPVWAHRGLAAGFARFLASFFFASCVDTGVHNCTIMGRWNVWILITENERGVRGFGILIGVSSYFSFNFYSRPFCVVLGE